MKTPTGTSWRVVGAAAFTVAACLGLRRHPLCRAGLPPGGLSLGRLIVGSACLSLMMVLGRRWVPMTRQEWGLVTLIGVLWFGIYSVAMGWIFLGEVPALLAVVGGVVSLIGVGIARRPSKPIR